MLFLKCSGGHDRLMQNHDEHGARNLSRERSHAGARLARLDAGCVAAVFPVSSEPLVIGRDPENPVFLGDTLASKRHAAVSFQGRRLAIADLNSLNGTWVNERRVKTQELAPGDVIRIGRTLYVCLVDGMPLKRADGGAAGRLLGQSPTGAMELPVTETPILIGRAPEADVRVAEDGIRDFHVQVSRVPGGVQAIQLAADPPRRFVLADGANLKVGGTVLLYRAGGVAPAAKPPRLFEPEPQGRRRAPARPVARPVAAPSQPPEANLLSLLEAESRRLDRDDARDTKPRYAWKCRVTARNGPLAGKTFTFLGRRITIGRGTKSKIRLQDQDVSRSHACLCQHEGDVVIVDLKSGNGVFVNGVPVQRAPLKPGDVIRIGSTEFLVHL